jgi:catalase
VHNYERDGTMRFDENGGGSVNYEPKSVAGPVEDHAFKEPPLHIAGDVIATTTASAMTTTASRARCSA